MMKIPSAFLSAGLTRRKPNPFPALSRCLARSLPVLLMTVLLILPFQALKAQNNYPNHQEMTERLHALSRSYPSLVRLESLTKTLGGKDIWLLSVGSGNLETRPAIAIVGGIAGDHLLGTELALQFAEKLLAGTGNQTSRQLLDSVTFYVFPDMSPDAREQHFTDFRYERLGNANPSDYDGDGKINEDPYNDLNGDGQITLMRIKDPRGGWITHPEDVRIMVRARPESGQQGEYFLYSEGLDQDKDGLFNEDGAEGVIFNKNFSFKYPAFTAGAGENAVSENETRAIADFLFAAKNVFAVISFGPANNLTEPLRYNEREAGGRIPGGWQEEDIKINQLLSLSYNQHLGFRPGDQGGSGGAQSEKGPRSGTQETDTRQEVVSPPGGTAGSDGDLFQWAYYHYGRFSFSTPAWWVPAEPAGRGAMRGASGAGDMPGRQQGPGDGATGSRGSTTRGTAMQQGGPGGRPGRASTEEIMAGIRHGGGSPEVDSRGQLNLLRWAEKNDVSGIFVPWTRFNHPDFPGREVEIGGIAPFVMKNPPYEMTPAIAEKHLAFILDVAEMRPQVRIENIRTEALGNNLFRVTADIVNRGSFPTVSQMGQRIRWVQKTVIRTTPSAAQKVISGQTVDIIDGIDGRSSIERSWLIQGKGAFEIRAGAESSGFDSHTVSL